MAAFVLGGGSVRGAFQAGALSFALKSGVGPDSIYGISVGALNGAFLADRAGRAVRAGQTIDWQGIGSEIGEFWEKNITSPDSLIRKKSGVAIGLDIVFKRFDGLVSTDPLQKLVRSQISMENLVACPVPFAVGTVDLNSGEIVYADNTKPNFIDYVIASSAIPISMPISPIGNGLFYDGGLRDIAPVGTAINRGGTNPFYVILCQAENLSAAALQKGNILSLVDRVVDIVKNEITRNDLEEVSRVNQQVAKGDKAHRTICYYLIEPAAELTVDIESFSSADIEGMIVQGAAAAQAALAQPCRQ